MIMYNKTGLNKNIFGTHAHRMQKQQNKRFTKTSNQQHEKRWIRISRRRKPEE